MQCHFAEEVSVGEVFVAAVGGCVVAVLVVSLGVFAALGAASNVFGGR